MMDFNHGSGFVYGQPKLTGPSVTEIVNTHIDEAMLAARNNEVPREYLGASRIGEPCKRKLAYEYMKVPGKPFTGKQLRIFAAGHKFEDMMTDWLRAAGFVLKTENSRGRQFGFETAGGRVKGHIDGALVSGPDLGQPYPGGWECKAINDKSWNDTVRKGVKVSKPIYYAQMQIYMAYLSLPWFLFTALNKNTQELYHEVVLYDPAEAQRLSDKAVEVIQAAEHGELPPRIADASDFYLCKWCDHRSVCWGLEC